MKLLAVDTPSPDHLARRDPTTGQYPIHRTLLSEDVPIVNISVSLASLAGNRPSSVSAVLRGGDGAPFQFVAAPTAAP